MIVTPRQIQEAEQALFAKGVSAESLMDKAALRMAEAIRRFFPSPGLAVAYLGRGHNAGDALEAARHLAGWGWEVRLRLAEDPSRFSPLTAKKYHHFLANHAPREAEDARPLILLDGLLGVGARGPLREGYRELAREMNERRQSSGARTVAIDIPSGLDGTIGEPSPDAVIADFTLTVAYAKMGLLADSAVGHVGRLEVIPLPEIPPPAGADASARVLTAEVLRGLLPPRPHDWHKGDAGRVAVLAGSRGFTGAACLTSEAAVVGGAGLVSLFVGEGVYPIVAGRAIPEVMVRPVESLTPNFLASLEADAFVVGPGLGPDAPVSLLEWLTQERRPVLLDADGLNLLARHAAAMPAALAAGPRLLTPHPGEFRRLFPREGELPTRRERAEAAVAEANFALLYKGARTIIAQRGMAISFNTTGHPGMAGGGMGDALAGMAGAFLARGIGPRDSACLAAWLSGRAAEIAVTHGGQTHETFRASHVTAFLAEALRDLRGTY